MTRPAFTFKSSPKSIELILGRQVIARLDPNYGWGLLRDVVLRPGGDPLISLHQLVPTVFGRVAQRPVAATDGHSLTLQLDADSADGVLQQETTVHVSLAADGQSLLWDFRHATTVLKNSAKHCRFFARTDVDPRYAATGVWHFEITDPMPHRAFAPKDGPVPVDRPDILFPQAWFRKGGWEKNWTHFAFQRDDGRLVRIPMNHLDNHDKDFWKQAPDGLIAMLGGAGTNLKYQFLDGCGTNICHHYCMWGYDIHFFEIVAPGSGASENPPPVLKAGRQFKHHYRLEFLSDAAADALLAAAEEHPWRERDQRRLENAPVCKPGLNQFQERLGRQDDRGFFQPSSQCLYLPHHPGRRTPGVLLIENDNPGVLTPAEQKMFNSWQIGLGADNWHTPIEGNRVYEVSVWVKLETGDADAFARLGAGYDVQYDQATPRWRVERGGPFYSEPVKGKSGWHRLVLRIPRLPKAYVSTIRVAMELHGRGTCYFDEFEFRLVEP